jgi:hypothetical protein
VEHGFESPVALPEAEPMAGGLAWTAVTIGIATLFLLATNAVALEDWVADMPASPEQAQALELAGEWRDLTDRACLGVPRAWLHARWKAWEAARF